MFLFLLLPLSAWAGETLYSAVIEDLPLMQGMTEHEDDAVVFDAPAGRIVETFASASFAPRDIVSFYDRSLPPLGWQKMSAAQYVRDGETLKITFEGDSLVHFSLTPEGK